MTTALLIFCLAMDLGSIKSEANLDKRSTLALDYAEAQLDAARDAYNAGDMAKFGKLMEDVRAAVELSYQSLVDTGKTARHDSHFKRAEVRTREVLRRLDGLRDVVGYEDRATVEKVRAKVSEVHDELLEGIMSKKK